MMKRLLLAVVLCLSMSLSAKLKFAYEDELYDMTLHADLYTKRQLGLMFRVGNHWLNAVVTDYKEKKTRISRHDQIYLGCISCMVAQVGNKAGIYAKE